MGTRNRTKTSKIKTFQHIIQTRSSMCPMLSVFLVLIMVLRCAVRVVHGLLCFSTLLVFEIYSIQSDVINIVSDLWKVDDYCPHIPPLPRPKDKQNKNIPAYNTNKKQHVPNVVCVPCVSHGFKMCGSRRSWLIMFLYVISSVL
jgi:hypothetical protein